MSFTRKEFTPLNCLKDQNNHWIKMKLVSCKTILSMVQERIESKLNNFWLSILKHMWKQDKTHIDCLMKRLNHNYLSIPKSEAAVTSQFQNPITLSFKSSSAHDFKLLRIFSWTESNSVNFIVKSSISLMYFESILNLTD